MSTLRVCVITATRNRAETFLPACVTSVKEQILADSAGNPIEYRHVIVDDASTDTTREYLDDLAIKDPHLCVVHTERNRGPAVAMRLGTDAVFHESSREFEHYGKHAKETLPHYFIPLDDDDMLPPNAFQVYAEACRSEWRYRRKLPGMIFGPAILIDEFGKQITEATDIDYNNIPPTEDREDFIRAMLDCNHLPSKPALSFWNFQPHAFSPELNCWDWALIMEALLRRVTYRQVAEPTSCYRIHPGQISHIHRAQGIWEAERETILSEMNPLVQTPITPEQLDRISRPNGLPIHKKVSPIE